MLHPPAESARPISSQGWAGLVGRAARTSRPRRRLRDRSATSPTGRRCRNRAIRDTDTRSAPDERAGQQGCERHTRVAPRCPTSGGPDSMPPVPFPIFRHPAMPLIILFLKPARRPRNPIFPSCSPIPSKAAPAVRRRDAESAISRNRCPSANRSTPRRSSSSRPDGRPRRSGKLSYHAGTPPCVRRSWPGWAVATARRRQSGDRDPAGQRLARSALRLCADGDRPVEGLCAAGRQPEPVLPDLRRRGLSLPAPSRASSTRCRRTVLRSILHRSPMPNGPAYS